MPFILPIKRSSITGLQVFSDYKEIKTLKYFTLQRHKGVDEESALQSNSRPLYRIISFIPSNNSIFYEIAYNTTNKSILQYEWKYITSTMSNLIKLNCHNLNDDEILKWINAHITKFVLQFSRKNIDYQINNDLEQLQLEIQTQKLAENSPLKKIKKKKKIP